MITFRKYNKNSVPQQVLKILCTWQTAFSILAECVVYFLEFLSGNCSNLTTCTHRTSKTTFFLKKERFIKKSGYSKFQYRLSENLPLHVRKTLNVDQLLHCYWMKKLTTKNYSCLADHATSKPELTKSYYVAFITILWPSVQMILKQSSPELRNFLWHFLIDSYLKYSYTYNRRCSTALGNTCCNHWMTEMHVPATNLMIHTSSLLSPTAKVTVPFANSARELTCQLN